MSFTVSPQVIPKCSPFLILTRSIEDMSMPSCTSALKDTASVVRLGMLLTFRVNVHILPPSAETFFWSAANPTLKKCIRASKSSIIVRNKYIRVYFLNFVFIKCLSFFDKIAINLIVFLFIVLIIT